MTVRFETGVFFGKCRGFLFSCGMASALLLSACGTPPDGSVAGARKTGTFPNLNIKPEVAAAQITPDEKTTKFAELKSAQARQSGSAGAGVPASDTALLKRLADTHATDTLKQIEAE